MLYNGIMMTGSLATDFQPKKSFRLPSRGGEKRGADVEAGIISTMFGRGQLLFLVRTVDKAQVARLMTAGYRFAQPNHVGDIIARSMAVPQNEMLNTVDRLQKYAQQCAEAPLESSTCTYLACFAMRASVNKANGSWEVLVPIDSPFQLPQVELTQDPLKPWQQKILTRLDGLSVNQCLSWLNNKAAECPLPGDKEFLEILLDQVTALNELGGAKVIMCTAPNTEVIQKLVGGLSVGGQALRGRILGPGICASKIPRSVSCSRITTLSPGLAMRPPSA